MFTALAAPAGLGAGPEAAARRARPSLSQPRRRQRARTASPGRAQQPGAQTAPQAVPPAAPGAPPPPPPPPPVWTMADANQLLLTILDSAKEGLDPDGL